MAECRPAQRAAHPLLAPCQRSPARARPCAPPLPRPAHASPHLPAPARSREAKKIFETALMESRRMSMSFITPEHILLALLAVGDGTSRTLLEGWVQ